jgi:biotin operon repressor
MLRQMSPQRDGAIQLSASGTMATLSIWEPRRIVRWLGLLARSSVNGLTNKEIARELGISRHTVKFHIESLMRKLGVSTRTEAVSKSMRLKLLEPYRI